MEMEGTPGILAPPKNDTPMSVLPCFWTTPELKMLGSEMLRSGLLQRSSAKAALTGGKRLGLSSSLTNSQLLPRGSS